MNKEDVLKAVMSEYEILKNELIDTVKFQLQIYTFTLSAISVVLGFILIYEKYEALLFVPFITIMLAYRWIWDLQMSFTYSRYIRDIESKKIPELIGFFRENQQDHLKYWIGWQHYYDEQSSERTQSWFYSMALLLGFPTCLSIIYFVWFLYTYVIHVTHLMLIIQYPYILYLLAIILYSPPCFHILYKLYKLRQMRIKNA